MSMVVENDDAPTDPIMEHMAAGAFGALCEHLRLRSDLVQNIDLMTVGGFCRNCMAKVRGGSILPDLATTTPESGR
jgi:hypothetical protein